MEHSILKTMESAEQDEVMKVIEQAADELDESEEETNRKWHERTTETTTIRALLKRQKEGRIKLPLCQRLYIWDKNKRAALLKSIEQNYSCGTIIVAENDKTQYLVDGLQRLTSCMYLSVDYDNMGLTENQKRSVLNYSITLSIVKDMNENEIKEYFSRLNSGVAIAAVVKERSKLSDKLNHAILSVSSNTFFRDAETSTTFNKGHHHELIAMNTLLAVSGVEQNENKAKTLCKCLLEHETEVLQNIDKAQILVNRIAEIYNGISKDIVKRSLNANFMGTLVYVMARTDYNDEQISRLINHIFAGKRAISSYTATTNQGAGDAKKCKARYDLLIKLLESPLTIFEQDKFKEWASKKEVIQDTDKKYDVDFMDFDDDEQKALYMAHVEGKASVWNSLVKKVYKRLETETENN